MHVAFEFWSIVLAACDRRHPDCLALAMSQRRIAACVPTNDAMQSKILLLWPPQYDDDGDDVDYVVRCDAASHQRDYFDRVHRRWWQSLEIRCQLHDGCQSIASIAMPWKLVAV